MEPLTTTLVAAAADHRALAEFVANVAPAQVTPPPRWVERTTVTAFYSAVHYVNAYLWERRRFVPANHTDRNTRVRIEPGLAPLRPDYRLLSSWAWNARYVPTFSLPPSAAAQALSLLATIAHPILQDLAST